MTVKTTASQIGDFSIFGYTRDQEGFQKRRLSGYLGVSPTTIDFGNAGHLFFYTSYGDLAVTDEAIALKLGFVRSLTKTSLSAQELLNHKIVGPGSVDSDKIRGNALIVCISKTEPEFLVYKTILGVPQLYYYISGDEIICSDRLKCIAMLMDQARLNEDIIPMHFLFRSTPGDLTYYQHIKRMLPGQLFKWSNGQASFKLIQDFNFSDDPVTIKNATQNPIDNLYETLELVVHDYVSQAETNGNSLATLLSGGVDSSLIQFLINQYTSYSPSRTYSFAVRVPSFSHEIEYANRSSILLNTDHTFVDFKPEDYLGLIKRSVDHLAQPPILETEPSMLSIAEYIDENNLTERYFFSGQGADTVFGLTYSKKLKGLFTIGKIPGASLILKGLSGILKPVSPVSRSLLKGSKILECANDPDAFLSPFNTIAVYGDLDIIRRCFGDSVLQKALEYRREYAAQYLYTNHYLEKVHLIDLMTDTYELGVQRQQLFLAYKREQLHPFYDDDTLRTAFAIPPDERYIKGLRPKYLLKDLLELKTGSQISRKPKGFSVFEEDLLKWMHSGPLLAAVQEIKLPAFMNKIEFDRLLNKPDYFLWVLFIFDIFQQRCFPSSVSSEF